MSNIIPTQRTGEQSNTEHVITAATKDDAVTLFNKARKNLLNVNSWQHLSGALSAAFQLTDAAGNHIQRTPQKGDYFKIDIPGPGNEGSRGYDWVQVEEIQEQLQDAEHTYSAIKVRPAKAPKGNGDACHHFFTAEATSTFFVERKGKQVKAAVLGRNEKPNTDSKGFFNKIRNAVVGFFAMLGFNKPQWASLVKGILEKDADATTFQE